VAGAAQAVATPAFAAGSVQAGDRSILRDDLDAPRKQRHTVKRIFDRLVAEHEMEGISYGYPWQSHALIHHIRDD
jgi:hypothetical protein